MHKQARCTAKMIISLSKVICEKQNIYTQQNYHTTRIAAMSIKTVRLMTVNNEFWRM